MTHTLLNETSFSGWGIRTLDANAARYNPMHYHNGSVWPHDNAIIAAGMARYDRKDAAVKVLSGLFDASLCHDTDVGVHLERKEGEVEVVVVK